MTYDQSKVAFVDTETCGLDPERHPIWDIAVIVDGVEHEWQQKLSPVRARSYKFADHYPYVDQWVLDNTRIIEDYNRLEALDPSASIRRFIDLTRGRHLVGACPWFDSERLHRVQLHEQVEGRQHPWHYHLIDVETLIVGYLVGLRVEYGDEERTASEIPMPWDSKALSLRLGVDPDDFQPAHTAITDARWAKACYEAIMGNPFASGEGMVQT